MNHSNRELWASFFTIILITLAYLFVVYWIDGIPRAGDLFGHGLGILGFLLMLMTETLYSLRKRSRRASWGRMSSWLSFHIFTGLVGPYMVLLHTSWKFNGLAGVVTLLTIIIVASGFVGRYIYTAVPRTADGVEWEAGLLRAEISAAEAELGRWLEGQPESLHALARRMVGTVQVSGGQLALIFARPLIDWGDRFQWRLEKGRMDPSARARVVQLEQMLRRLKQLRSQAGALASARRLLAVWHAVHIPIGMALFAAAFVHIAAAIYYATLLR
jgi:hypothetical protein